MALYFSQVDPSLGVLLHDEIVWLGVSDVPVDGGILVNVQLYRVVSGELVVKVAASYPAARRFATVNLSLRPIPYLQPASSSVPLVVDGAELCGAGNPYLE